MTKCTLGIDVGKSNIRVAIAEDSPELKYYCKWPYRSSTANEFEEQLTAAIDRATWRKWSFPLRHRGDRHRRARHR